MDITIFWSMEAIQLYTNTLLILRLLQMFTKLLQQGRKHYKSMVFSTFVAILYQTRLLQLKKFPYGLVDYNHYRREVHINYVYKDQMNGPYDKVMNTDKGIKILVDKCKLVVL